MQLASEGCRRACGTLIGVSLLLLVGCGEGGQTGSSPAGTPVPDLGAAVDGDAPPTDTPDSDTPGPDTSNPGAPEIIRLPAGPTGPLDDLAQQARQRYEDEDGQTSPAIIDANSTSRLVDVVIFGAFADPVSPVEDSSQTRSLLDINGIGDLPGNPINYSPPDRYEKLDEDCANGGIQSTTHATADDTDQGVPVRLIRYEDCRDETLAFDGTVIVTYAADSDGSSRAGSALHLGFDELRVSRWRNENPTTYLIHGTESWVNRGHCRKPRERLSTLMLSALDGRTVLYDKLLTRAEGETAHMYCSEAYGGENVFDGAISISHLGRFDLSTPQPLLMSRGDYGMPSYVGGVSDAFNADPAAGLRITGADQQTALFRAESLVLDSSGQQVREIVTLTPFGDEVSADDRLAGSTEILRISEQMFSRGVFAAMVDTDEDGIPDGVERYYGFDENDPLDAALDADADGLSNLEEYRWLGDPHRDHNRGAYTSHELSISPTLTPAVGGATVGVDVSMARGYGYDSVLAEGFTVAVEGARWDADSLHRSCTLDDTEQHVRCKIEDSNAERRDATEVFDFGTWAVLPDGEGKLSFVSQLDRTPLGRIDTAEPESIELEFERFPQPDFTLEVPTLVFGNADSPAKVSAQITHSSKAVPVDVEVVVSVPDGVIVQEADLRSSGQQALISRCVIAEDVRCVMDAMEPDDVLDLQLDVYVIDDGRHRLDWALSVIDAPVDTDPVQAQTQVEYAQSVSVLQALIDAADPDDTVNLPAGRYVGTLNGLSKTLHVIGAPENTPTILSSTDANAPLLLRPGSESVYRRLVFESTGAPIMQNSAANLTLAESIFRPVAGAVHNLDGLFDGDGVSSFRVLRSLITGWGKGQDNQCGHLLKQTGGAGGYTTDVYLQHNRIVNNDCEAVIWMNADDERVPRTFFIQNNTLVDNPAFLTIVGSGYGPVVHITNNIIVGTASLLDLSDDIYNGPTWTSTNFQSARNLVWESERQALLTGTLAARNGITVVATDVNADPLFADREGGDFSLTVNSPAIDRAAPSTRTYWWEWSSNVEPEGEERINDPERTLPLDGNGDSLIIHDIGAMEYAP